MTDRNVNININGKDNASAAIGKVGNSFDVFRTQLASLKGLVGGFVLGTAVRMAVGKFQDISSSIDEIGKASDRIGITTEALGGLKWAAEQSGVAFEPLATSLTKLNRTLSEIARGGARPAEDSLTELGLSAESLFKLPFDQQFGKIADGLKKIQNPADRTRIVMDLFGRSGADLLNLLDQGSVGIAKFREEAEKMGLLFTREDAAQVEQYNDSLNKLGKSFDALWQKIVIGSSPAVTAVLDRLTSDLLFIQSSLTEGIYGPPEVSQADRVGGAAGLAGIGSVETKESKQATREARQKSFLERIGLVEKPSENPVKDLLDMWEGGKAGVGSVMESVKKTGEDIGGGLAEGVKKGWEDSKQRLQDRITELTEMTKTPLEIFQESMLELDNLEGSGGLPSEIADRRRRQLEKDLKLSQPDRFTPQLQAREFRALTMAPGAGSPELQAAQKQTKALEDLNKKTDVQIKVLGELLSTSKTIADNAPEVTDL